MNLFIKRLSLFFLPLILLITLAELDLRNIPTLFAEKRKGLEADADSIELLILGNSHGQYGINPRQFDCYAYNMAQAQQSLYFDKRITMKYIDKLVKLKYVLISVDFHSLYFSTERARNIWTYYGYGIEYKNEVNIYQKISRIYGYSPRVSGEFIKRSLLYKYGKIKNPMLPVDLAGGENLHDTIDRGWFPFDATDYKAIGGPNTSVVAGNFNNIVHTSTEKKDITADLEDFIFQLKERNIIPILITAPCDSAFISLLDKNVLKQNRLIIDSICQKFNLQYWDYLELPLDESDFHDCDHLDRKGANIFSKLLNQRLKDTYGKIK